MNISRTALSHFMSILPFDLSKTSIISYTHRTVKQFTATRQKKTPRQKYINIVQQNVFNATLIKTLSF